MILPDGGDYERYLGKRGVAGLKAWVERGGVLIGLGRANRFCLARSYLQPRELRAGEGQDKSEAKGG